MMCVCVCVAGEDQVRVVRGEAICPIGYLSRTLRDTQALCRHFPLALGGLAVDPSW